jgi:hypothetical protein
MTYQRETVFSPEIATRTTMERSNRTVLCQQSSEQQLAVFALGYAVVARGKE